MTQHDLPGCIVSPCLEYQALFGALVPWWPRQSVVSVSPKKGDSRTIHTQIGLSQNGVLRNATVQRRSAEQEWSFLNGPCAGSSHAKVGDLHFTNGDTSQFISEKYPSLMDPTTYSCLMLMLTCCVMHISSFSNTFLVNTQAQ